MLQPVDPEHVLGAVGDAQGVDKVDVEVKHVGLVVDVYSHLVGGDTPQLLQAGEAELEHAREHGDMASPEVAEGANALVRHDGQPGPSRVCVGRGQRGLGVALLPGQLHQGEPVVVHVIQPLVTRLKPSSTSSPSLLLLWHTRMNLQSLRITLSLSCSPARRHFTQEDPWAAACFSTNCLTLWLYISGVSFTHHMFLPPHIYESKRGLDLLNTSQVLRQLTPSS